MPETSAANGVVVDAPAVPRYLTREEAAAYLSDRLRGPINAKQLAGWGAKGPHYVMFRGAATVRRGGRGRWALYTMADLDAWIESQIREPHPNGHS